MSDPIITEENFTIAEKIAVINRSIGLGVFYGTLCHIDELLKKYPGSAEAFLESSILKDISIRNIEYACEAVVSVLKARPDLARDVWQNDVVEKIFQEHRQYTYRLVLAFLETDFDHPEADLKIEQVIRESGYLQSIIQDMLLTHSEDIEETFKFDKEILNRVGNNHALMRLFSGHSGMIDFLSKKFSDFAQRCEVAGTLEENNIVKLEKGYLLNDFQIAVSEASPHSKCHTMMIVDSKTHKETVLASDFHGTLDEFKEAIEIDDEYRDLESPDRIHEIAVHNMYARVVQQALQPA